MCTRQIISRVIGLFGMCFARPTCRMLLRDWTTGILNLVVDGEELRTVGVA